MVFVTHVTAMPLFPPSQLMNSNLLPSEQKENIPIQFRIVGRDAWKVPAAGMTKTSGHHNDPNATPQPLPSWSVPLRWFWTMPRHVNKQWMNPMPLELPDVNDGQIPVLENFQRGSKGFMGSVEDKGLS